MRILMMGTGGFAVPAFEWLLRSEHEVPALITRPKSGRRDKRSKITDPMREVAEQHNVVIHDPPSINDPEAITLLQQLAPELMIVCDYGQILSREALSVAPLGGINLHASLLPKYRGAAPINWAIYAGESVTGVTVIHMTPRLDAGPCLVQRTVSIGADETSPELEARLAELGVEAVQEAIAQLEAWDRTDVLGTVQDQAQATKAPRLKKSDGQIDWSRSAHEIDCQIRALKPWPGTFTYLPRTGKPPLRLLVERAEPADDPPDTARPGTVVQVERGLVVATGNGGLRIDRLQPEGKKPLAADEFVRGYRLEVGTRLTGP